MKFKEALNLNQVKFCENKEKMFSHSDILLLSQMEKTVGEFWNIEEKTANLINMLIKIKNVKSALEIGTSNGYSSIWIAKALETTKGHLTTIEFWEKRLELAKENFIKTGTNDLITTFKGDAIEILADFAKQNLKFDFVFIDANKAEYIEYFKSIDLILEKNGVIVADNILSHYKKTLDYINTLFQNENYQSEILNIEAGLMISYKK